MLLTEVVDETRSTGPAKSGLRVRLGRLGDGSVRLEIVSTSPDSSR